MASVENYIPYQPNAQGLTEVLLDLKSTMPSQLVSKVTGYKTNSFEDLTQGDAVSTSAPTVGTVGNFSSQTSTATGSAGDLAGTITTNGAITLTGGGSGTSATGQFVSEISIR